MENASKEPKSQLYLLLRQRNAGEELNLLNLASQS